MSIYRAISLTEPMISYGAFHQVNEGSSRNDHLKSIREMHRAIEEESAKIQEAWEKHEAETLAHGTETLFALLRQFLQTPLQRDESEIRTLIREALTKHFRLVGLNVSYGLSASWEGEVVSFQTQNALVKRMMKAGTDYLRSLGFDTTTGTKAIFESLFVVHSGINLDILEHVIRERLAGGTPERLKHAEGFEEHGYITYNLVYLYGTQAMKLLEKDVTEAAIFFAMPKMQYTIFREGITDALDSMNVLLKPSYITLWQQKLGLGSGREFVLRLYLRGKDEQLDETNKLLSEAIRFLSTFREAAFIRECLVENGSLIVKQMVK